jgi:hypothetical protein
LALASGLAVEGEGHGLAAFLAVLFLDVAGGQGAEALAELHQLAAGDVDETLVGQSGTPSAPSS